MYDDFDTQQQSDEITPEEYEDWLEGIQEGALDDYALEFMEHMLDS